MDENKHYIRLDSNSFIVKGFSDAFENPLETDICIGEGRRHFQLNGVINPNLFSSDCIPLYKYENGNVVNLTSTDIQNYKNNLPVQPPSQENRLKAIENALLNL